MVCGFYSGRGKIRLIFSFRVSLSYEREFLRMGGLRFFCRGVLVGVFFFLCV